MMLLILLLIISLGQINSRIHHLSLEDDSRDQITLSTFGYLRHGYLQLSIHDLAFEKLFTRYEGIKNSFAFLLEKSTNGDFSTFKETKNKQEFCELIRKQLNLNSTAVAAGKATQPTFNFDYFNDKNEFVVFLLDLNANKVHIQKIGANLQDIQVSNVFHMRANTEQLTSLFKIKTSNEAATTVTAPNQTTVSSILETTELNNNDIINVYDEDHSSYLILNSTNTTNALSLSFQFEINMNRPSEEGIYELHFYNCFKTLNSESDNRVAINLTLELLEKNEDSYLSAGEMPLPTLYFTWALIYFLAAGSWIYIIKTSKAEVYKIHYLMLALVLIKSISLTFHSINLHYIALNGRHEAIWAILFYITYLLRGLLMIVSIVLVGTGWTFIKYVLSENERRLFVIVIPLQILVITAYIFLEEKEEGEAVYITWRQLFFLLDLICCALILFPIVWSIKHLEAASQTDGKAAVNLQKLKVFKQFYIMVICYIYFTRIIGYMLKLMVPFRYEWLDKLCTELVTFLFFALTAFKFQPARNNPYLQLSQEEYSLDNVENVLFDANEFDLDTSSSSLILNDHSNIYARKQQLQDIKEENV